MFAVFTDDISMQIFLNESFWTLIEICAIRPNWQQIIIGSDEWDVVEQAASHTVPKPMMV